jgi:hypothetical protein
MKIYLTANIGLTRDHLQNPDHSGLIPRLELVQAIACANRSGVPHVIYAFRVTSEK